MSSVKYLRNTPKNYAVQRPHKDNKSCSSGKTKRAKSVKFNRSFKDSNIMEHGDTILNKKKEKI